MKVIMMMMKMMMMTMMTTEYWADGSIGANATQMHLQSLQQTVTLLI
jgi:hypothetical protein